MLLTEEEYNKPINFRTKQVGNSVLAMKFHEAVQVTLRKIIEKEEYYIHSILDGKTKVKMKNIDYSNNTYPTRRINLEFRKVQAISHWYDRIRKEEIQYFTIDLNRDINYDIITYKGRVNTWVLEYYKSFIKFTSLQSKNFKKKLIKAVYIFENGTSDKKYRAIFNILVNYLHINLEKTVYNHVKVTKEAIDDTKLLSYTDRYYLTGYEKVLPPKENRNRAINRILKSKDLVDDNN